MGVLLQCPYCTFTTQDSGTSYPAPKQFELLEHIGITHNKVYDLYQLDGEQAGDSIRDPAVFYAESAIDNVEQTFGCGELAIGCEEWTVYSGNPDVSGNLAVNSDEHAVNLIN